MPLFGKSKEAREIEREVKYKQGLGRIRGYMERSKETQKRLWELGKRSLQLGDRRQFQNVVRAYLRTREVISRWERYTVAVETVAVQRGQMKATREFLQSMSALSDSMMAGAKPEEVLAMQQHLERALAKAQNLEETLAAVMDAAGEAVFSGEGIPEDALKDVEKAMMGEAATEESAESDSRIAGGIARVEEEMRKELR